MNITGSNWIKGNTLKRLNFSLEFLTSVVHRRGHSVTTDTNDTTGAPDFRTDHSILHKEKFLKIVKKRISKNLNWITSNK